MNTNYIGYIRTYIPVYVGLAITWLAENVGLIIDADTSASLKLGAAGLVVSVYYAVARTSALYSPGDTTPKPGTGIPGYASCMRNT